MPVRRSTAADGPKQCWAVRPSLIHRRIATRRRTSSVTSTATVIVWPAVCIVDTCVHTVQVSTSRGEKIAVVTFKLAVCVMQPCAAGR